MVNLMAKVNWSFKVEVNIKEDSSKASMKVMDNISGKMGTFTEDNIKKENAVGLVFLS